MVARHDQKLDGRAVLVESSKGEELTLKLADKVLVAAVVKASMADVSRINVGRDGASPP